MGFAEQVILAKDSAFQEKVRIALCAVAAKVVRETLSGSALKDEKRIELAREVLRSGGKDDAERVAWILSALPNFPAVNPSDAQIQTYLESAWSGLAGVRSVDG